jgi:ribonuclease R
MDAPLVTLDSRHTKDIDDALRVIRTVEGYFVEVAIANAASHVLPGSAEDQFALEAAATTYFGKRTGTHMLPPHISQHRGSLVANTKRPALVYQISLSEALEVLRFEVVSRSVLVNYQLHYELLPSLLEQRGHPAYPTVKAAVDLSLLLLAKRRNSGALAFFDLQRLLASTEEGKPVQFDSAGEAVGYILVQELMILVNCLGAQFLLQHNIPAIYRNHEARLASPSARDIASSVEDLLQAGAFDAQKISQTVALMSAVAEYGVIVRGHYGLTVPAYAHLTSPLRRYADLVNQRQLLAHMKGDALPYRQEDLEEISKSINATLAARKLERSQGFKDALEGKANRAISAARFQHLAEHELIKAIDLSVVAGALPEPLSYELARRFADDQISDRLVFAVLLLGFDRLLPPGLAGSCATWLEQSPGKALSFLTHAANVGRLVDVQVHTAPRQATPPVHEAVATARLRGARQGASAIQAGKRAAEQIAVLRLTGELVGLVVKTVADLPWNASDSKVGAPVEPSAPVAVDSEVLSAKGRLVELHQKLRWPAPVYQTTSSGESHRPDFSCTVALTTPSGVVTGTAAGAQTKKLAEMLAAAELLAKLDQSTLQSADAKKPASINAISALNSWTQSRQLPPPTYEFWSSKPNAGPFTCKVRIQGLAQLPGCRGDNKQAAKLAAAEAVWKHLTDNAAN